MILTRAHIQSPAQPGTQQKTLNCAKITGIKPAVKWEPVLVCVFATWDRSLTNSSVKVSIPHLEPITSLLSPLTVSNLRLRRLHLIARQPRWQRHEVATAPRGAEGCHRLQGLLEMAGVIRYSMIVNVDAEVLGGAELQY